MNEQEANQAAVEAAEYWAGMEEDLFSSGDYLVRISPQPPLKHGNIQILPDRQYPLRLHADDVALILRLEESNKKLLAKLEQVERLTGRLYDRT